MRFALSNATGWVGGANGVGKGTRLNWMRKVKGRDAWRRVGQERPPLLRGYKVGLEHRNV